MPNLLFSIFGSLPYLVRTVTLWLKLVPRQLNTNFSWGRDVISGRVGESDLSIHTTACIFLDYTNERFIRTVAVQNRSCRARGPNHPELAIHGPREATLCWGQAPPNQHGIRAKPIMPNPEQP